MPRSRAASRLRSSALRVAAWVCTKARRTARVSAGGELVTLVEQDRGAAETAYLTGRRDQMR
jgi:predicted RNA polymerase sigma factor